MLDKFARLPDCRLIRTGTYSENEKMRARQSIVAAHKTAIKARDAYINTRADEMMNDPQELRAVLLQMLMSADGMLVASTLKASFDEGGQVWDSSTMLENHIRQTCRKAAAFEWETE